MATIESSSNSMATRAKDIANRLTPLQKIALGAVVLTVVAGGMVLSKTGGKPEMAALYTDLSSADASSVVDSLSSRGEQYDLTDAGKTILVPKADVYDLRVALAGEGLPSSNEGYALLDNQGITTSEFNQRIDYQRALEGELAKTLMAMDDVKSASVHLALPDQSLFIDEPATPTASVLVSGKGATGIAGDEVEAIVHLVASSVKDMKPADVTVIDANGTVLSAAGEGVGGTSSNARAKATTEYENRVSASIMALLTRMAGPNKVAVTVNAQLDLDESQSTSENYEPIGTNPSEGQVLTEKTSTEQYGAAGSANSGTTGVLGPDGSVITDNTRATTGAGTDYAKDDQERTYALDRIVEQTTNVPGAVTKLNVAVLMDESAVTADQAAAVQAMVATAVGIDPARGDSIVVTRMPFDTSASTQADELAAADQKAASKEQMMGMVRTVAVLLVILIALFLGYRSAKNARKVTATPINIGEIGSGHRYPLAGGGEMPLGVGATALGAADQTMVLDQAP
ncbi:MAG: fliF, partial [Ilumatobacteraceae bacterium]|nr:fliF [Ilumatobacteraceae bacterium]